MLQRGVVVQTPSFRVAGNASLDTAGRSVSELLVAGCRRAVHGTGVRLERFGRRDEHAAGSGAEHMPGDDICR